MLPILTITLFIISQKALATPFVTPPANDEYKVFHHNGYRYIFSEEYRDLIPELIYYNEMINNVYQKEFRWKLDEETSLILASSKNQITNGLTTMIPNSMTLFYPSPGYFLDVAAEPSFLYTLLTHEVAHLYQTNIKPGENTLPSLLKKVFGNAPVLFAVVPLFPQPNLFQPNYLLEGNAVFNESRFGLGGRLYSGHIRSTIYNLILDHQTDYDHLINLDLAAPLDDYYTLSGYFQDYLIDNPAYPRESSANNIFFKAQSEHFINPLMLDITYRTIYRNGYLNLFDNFLSDTRKKIVDMKRSTKTPILTSFRYYPLNKSQNQIYFLTNLEEKEEPLLGVYDIASEKLISNQPTNMSAGKLFKINNQFYSVGSHNISPVAKVYSLYGKGASRLNKYDNTVVNDIQNNHEAYFDEKNSFKENTLYVDGKKIGPTHSTAVLDQEGNVYYFRQNKTQRTLYKNDQALFQIETYYAYPLEVLPDKILFISTSQFGSTLFAYENQKIIRMSPLDTIIDARQINENTFFAIESTSEGYAYYLETYERSESIPATYEYKFSSDETNDLFNKKDPEKISVLKEEVDNQSISYNGFKQLRYSYSTLGYYGDDKGGLHVPFAINFADPLLSHSVNIFGIYDHAKDDESSVAINYEFIPYRLQIDFSLIYDKDSYLVSLPDKYLTLDKEIYRIGLYYPFLENRLWDLNYGLDLQYERASLTSTTVNKTTHAYSTLSLSYSEQYIRAFKPYKYFQLELLHDFKGNESWTEISQKYAAKIILEKNLGNEFYLQLASQYYNSDKSDIEFTYDLDSYYAPFTLLRLTEGVSFDSREIKVTGLRLEKAIDRSRYFHVFPISLRRWAPYIAVNYYDFSQIDNVKNKNDFLIASQLGVTWELLFIHKFPLRVSSAFAKESNAETKSKMLSLSLGIKF